MKQPNEFWLKYMLLFSGLSREQIIASAYMYGMTEPSEDYLGELLDKLQGTRPARLDLSNSPTRTWVRRQRIMSLAAEQKHAIQARDLLGETKIRPVIETLIICDASLEDITKYTEKITGTKLPKKTVDMYRHYFWNRELLSSSDWFGFLKTHPEGKILKQCYKQGLEYALWRLGYRVELAQREVLRGVFHESAMRFFETSASPNNRDTAMTAKMWAENIFKATEELNKTGDEVRQVLDELKNVAVKLGRRDITSIDDLK
jgi:hypothetical protein